ncbi:UNVERIFIED_ORG: SAM-dependent methyltransferase [Rhizobium esperanzae]|nr:SAM-dependent methyltransferase [Rhizobium esperanzae]
MIDGTATDTRLSLHAKAWAEEYELIDSQLSPLGLQAMDGLNLVPGETVLDVGCGTGQTLLQLAERVGEQGGIYGVDISGPLLAVAAKRSFHLKSVQLIESDAATLELSDTTDAVFSRFGIMSFNDPVAAFSNFHRLLKPRGRLGFCCWRALQDSELDRFPLTAAGFVDAADETPFSFSDPEHIRDVLVSSGFNESLFDPMTRLSRVVTLTQ